MFQIFIQQNAIMKHYPIRSMQESHIERVCVNTIGHTLAIPAGFFVPEKKESH